MKTKRKALLLTFCAVLLVAASVLGTIAYLTAKDTVTNTFTVGNVAIYLDEAQVDDTGKAITGDNAKRVKANSYKLLPGCTYDKDPTVTVKAGSEKSYIKMTVTISKANELDAIFAPKGANLTDIFQDYDKDTWTYKGNTKGTAADTRTYEFWYKEAVTPEEDKDKALPALFKSIKVPDTITGEQLATIKGMTITVNAYAIQAEGFTSQDDAWKAFPADTTTTATESTTEDATTST